MKYAVIRINGKQYKVFEKEEILVEKLKKDPKVEVLLLVEDEKVQIGKPKLDDIKVEFKVIGQKKGRKLKILKYKAKSRYRRKMGFRPQLSSLLVEKISK